MSRVAVLIPNYNHAAYLPQCLASVIGQTMDGWTAVVGDNASTDESVAVISAFADRRIRLVRREATTNWVTNVNRLLAEAGDSDYIAILHADDWWEPSFLKTMVAHLDSATRSSMATCIARVVHPDAPATYTGLPYRRSAPTSTCPSAEAARLLAKKNWLCPAAVLLRRSLFERFPHFEESLPFVNDWLMWIRAATIGDVEVCQTPLANYRRHDQNLSKEATRANLWADDMVRMLGILQSEWAGGEPFKGARQAVAAGVANEILADAAFRALRGDTPGALREAALARSIAPRIRQRALVLAAEQTLRAADLPGLRAVRGPAAQAGRRLWRFLRPAA
jgi:hypothetical protein